MTLQYFLEYYVDLDCFIQIGAEQYRASDWLMKHNYLDFDREYKWLYFDQFIDFKFNYMTGCYEVQLNG